MIFDPRRADPRTRSFRSITTGLIALLIVPACGPSEPPGTGVSNGSSADVDHSSVANILSGPGMGTMDPNSPRLPEFEAPPEEVGTIRFRDVTANSGVDFVHRSGNSPDRFFPTANGSGVAMIDFDGDGLLDLYFASTRELPLDSPSDAMGNRLYRNLGGGRFEDATETAGVDFRGFCHGVAVGDFDGDGLPDLYLCNLGPNVLYLNNGDGTFRDGSGGSGADLDDWHSGAAVLDFDGDGHLDLYISSYGSWTEQDAKRFCGDVNKGVRTYCSPLTITPGRDYLLRNLGDGTFEDATESAGILRDDGRGLGVIAADLNGNALPDLYVANDLCPNFLFLNRGDGTFEDMTDISGASRSESGFDQAGMGVDAEDITGDGLPELFVTNFRGDYNTLYRNLGDGLFHDVTAWAGIVNDAMPEVGWACSFGDFDNDGWPDLVVFNGHVDENLSALGQDAPYAQPAKVWRNLGTGRMRLVRDPGPFFAQDHVIRGAAFGDLDNDGAIDIVVNRLNGRPAILLNDSEPGHWIRLELQGRNHRPTVGASVEVHVADRVIRRLVKGGGSYLSSNDPRILIGLGEAEAVDRVVIRWPGGGLSELTGPEVDRTHRVIEEASAGPEVGQEKAE